MKITSLNVRGLIPAGEGAGYAGGITSAAIDGIKIFEFIGKIFTNRKIFVRAYNDFFVKM